MGEPNKVKVKDSGNTAQSQEQPLAPFRWDNYDSVCRDAKNWIVGWEEMMQIANTIAAQNRELVEALASIDQLMMAMPLTPKIEHQVHGIAHRALAKVRAVS